MNGCMCAFVHACLLLVVRKYGCMHASMDACAQVWMHACKYGCMRAHARARRMHSSVRMHGCVFVVKQVTDFGHSKGFDSAVDTMVTRCGTVQYQAPEIVAGLPYVGTQADIVRFTLMAPRMSVFISA